MYIRAHYRRKMHKYAKIMYKNGGYVSVDGARGSDNSDDKMWF